MTGEAVRWLVTHPPSGNGPPRAPRPGREWFSPPGHRRAAGPHHCAPRGGKRPPPPRQEGRLPSLPRPAQRAARRLSITERRRPISAPDRGPGRDVTLIYIPRPASPPLLPTSSGLCNRRGGARRCCSCCRRRRRRERGLEVSARPRAPPVCSPPAPRAPPGTGTGGCIAPRGGRGGSCGRELRAGAARGAGVRQLAAAPGGGGAGCSEGAAGPPRSLCRCTGVRRARACAVGGAGG